MFAAALCLSKKDIDAATKKLDRQDIESFLNNKLIPAAKSVMFKSGDKAKDLFLEKMVLAQPTKKKPLTPKEIKTNDDILSDTLRGLSAAKSVREYCTGSDFSDAGKTSGTPRVYMTGNEWHPDVEKFNISGHGMKNYNSADVLMTYNGVYYFGISLKKKDFPNAPDPTVINKSFAEILNNETFKTLRDKLLITKKIQMGKIVQQAVNNGTINFKDVNKTATSKFKSLSEFNKWCNTTVIENKMTTYPNLIELNDSTFLDEKIFGRTSSGRMTYINVKGWANSGVKLPYQIPDSMVTDKDSMRSFVNKSLSNYKHPLWAEYSKILNQYAELFGQVLITTILKDELYNDLLKKGIDVDYDQKKMKKGVISTNKFAFLLVTGMGVYNSKTGKGSVSPAHIVPLKTTLCGLTRIKKQIEKGGKGYRVEVDVEKSEKRVNAAKLFMTLKGGDITVMEMELRFKGDFQSSPQFQAFTDTSFKTLLDKNCG